MSREGRRARYARRVEAALFAAIEAGRIDVGEVYTIDVAHDPWCRGLAGKGPCNCNPAVGPIRQLGQGPLADYAISQLVHQLKGT
jgi:hypothetical protein